MSGPLAHRHVLLPVGLAVCVAVSIAGCGGSDRPARQTAAGAGLAVHQGRGFSVGYPKEWRPDPAHRVFRSADFEVRPVGAGSAQASLSVFTEPETRSTERLLDGFVARSKRSRDFRLLARKRLDADGFGGREAHVIRKAYTSSDAAGRRTPLRQVDLFVRLSATSVVDVRMLFAAGRYDTSQRQISAVLDSFEVRS
jgi:hypothetical protein